MAFEHDFEKSKFNAELADIKKQLIERNYTASELIDYCALLIVHERTQDEQIAGLNKLLDDCLLQYDLFEKGAGQWMEQSSTFLEAVINYKATVPLRIKIGIKKDKSRLSRLAAQAKIAADPRQAEKSYIFQCWQVWQEEPERYTFKSDFAKAMLNQEQCRSLKSQKVIEDWCREWEKAHPAG